MRTGTREEWLTERISLLEREKELTRRSDELASARRDLPWVPIEKEYVFATEEGPRSLAELFAGRSQLLVYHFMHGPNCPSGCTGCSFAADSFDGAVPHLNAHDVALVMVSRSPLRELLDYRARMGWDLPWVSTDGNDFNRDFGAWTEEDRASGRGWNFGTPAGAAIDLSREELMGLSAFALEDGIVHHTYSAFDRGTDALITTWGLLDRTPKGREHAEPDDFPRRHDEYGPDRR